MRVIQIVNSAYGVRNAIGARPMHVAGELPGDTELIVLARGATAEARRRFDVRRCGVGPVLGKVLKAVNVYLWQGFPHKAILQRRFEGDASRWIRRLPMERCDLVHTWAEIPQILAEAKRRNPRLVVIRDVSMCPFCDRPGFGPDASDTVQRDAPVADYFLAPSPIVAHTMVNRCGIEAERIFTVPFGVDVELFRPRWLSGAAGAGGSTRGPGRNPRARDENKHYGDTDQRAPGVDTRAPGPFSVAFSGHVDRRKGIPELLEAWESLSSAPGFDGAELHLYGRVYPDVRPLFRGAESRGVRLRGFMDLPEELPKHDLFVLPSHREGSAKSVYEALACGLPVVTTPEAGSVVREGIEGRIVPAGDAGALAEAIRFYRENEGAREQASRGARARAEEFTWERYGRRVAEVYAEAVARGPWHGSPGENKS